MFHFLCSAKKDIFLLKFLIQLILQPPCQKIGQNPDKEETDDDNRGEDENDLPSEFDPRID